MHLLSEKIKTIIRDIPDFPKKGVVFKDITPILSDQGLVKQVVEALLEPFKNQPIDAVASMESRGFWFGTLLANKLEVPFIPIRKEGKLPGDLVSCNYDLEYGSACIEMAFDAVKKDWNVLIHDDVLATGGTAAAACELVRMLEGKVAGLSFLIDLSFLKGRNKLKPFSENIHSLLSY